MIQTYGKAEWSRIKSEYIHGGVSCRELAVKYGVSVNTLSKTATRENWAGLRRKTSEKVAEKMAESAAEHEAERAEMLYNAADLLLNKIVSQIKTSEYLSPGEISAYMMALERCKRICDIRCLDDIEEQRARIDKLRKESSCGDRTDEEFGVIILPEIKTIEE